MLKAAKMRRTEVIVKNGMQTKCFEVAARLGLDQSDVSKIERGERAVGKGLAKKIQKEFGIDYRRFL